MGTRHGSRRQGATPPHMGQGSRAGQRLDRRGRQGSCQMSETTWPVRADRRRAREDLTRGRFDLLVIGGGIIGISTAWTAAQAGMRVALIGAGDFAGATSSASTKL